MVDAPAGSLSLFDHSVPVTASPQNDFVYTLGLSFRLTRDGLISGISFYRNPAPTDQTTSRMVALFIGDGIETIVASAASSNEPVEGGWVYVPFAQPYQATANLHYVAAVEYPGYSYIASPAYFTSEVRRGDIIANPDGDALYKGNGRFYSGPGLNFPAGSFNATNYWVDIALVPIATGITASFNQTEAPDTLVSTAKVRVGAQLSIQEGGDTLAATAKARVSASAAIAEAADTLASSGAVRISASSSISEGADTLASSAKARVTANAAITEGVDTVSAAASGRTVFTLAAQEEPDTLAATGRVAIGVTANLIEQPDALLAMVFGEGSAQATLPDWRGQISFDPPWTARISVDNHALIKAAVEAPDVLDDQVGLTVYFIPGWYAERTP